MHLKLWLKPTAKMSAYSLSQNFSISLVLKFYLRCLFFLLSKKIVLLLVFTCFHLGQLLFSENTLPKIILLTKDLTNLLFLISHPPQAILMTCSLVAFWLENHLRLWGVVFQLSGFSFIENNRLSFVFFLFSLPCVYCCYCCCCF